MGWKSKPCGLFCWALFHCICIKSACPALQLENEWTAKDLYGVYRAQSDILPTLEEHSSVDDPRRAGPTRRQDSENGGTRCVPTKVAKPMRGECVGPTNAKFYTGAEVQAGSPMWRVQYLPLRTCVEDEQAANLRSQEVVSALVQIDPFLFSLGTADVQDQCRRRWVDIRYPPTFFFTCNDPLTIEEAQLDYTGSAAEFRQEHLENFKASTAQAINNLKAVGSNMTVTAADVEIINVTDAAPCPAPASNSTPAPFCDKRLTTQARDGIRVRFRVLNQEATYDDLDNVLYVADAIGGEIQSLLALVLEEFIEVQMTRGRDHTICAGPSDQTTCLAGDVCRPITERAAWTSFTSLEWWSRADRVWFGGTVPDRSVVREWYCDNDPRLFVGKVKIGQVGSADFYLRSSNPQVKSECDREGGGAPDRHCAQINQTSPVPGDCCGYCFLSNLHLMKLFNCTGMQDPLTNRELVQTIADYCLRTQLCKEQRPCAGDPVRMGDPFELLKASTYDIYCDPLDRGCDAAYIDGRPVQPGERACGYKFACDFHIPSLRARIGYYFSEPPAAPPPPATSSSSTSSATVAAVVVGVLCGAVAAGLCVLVVRRRLRRADDRQKRKELKALRKHQLRREQITGSAASDP